MIEKHKFYPGDDEIPPKKKETIWYGVENEMLRNPIRKRFFEIPDLRSFSYGIAASIVFIFAMYGAYTAVQKAVFSSRPDEIKIDAAYRSALREFEKVLPYAERAARSSGSYTMIPERKEQLFHLDEEISVLQRELRHGDLSPVKQAKLRELYTLKLQIFQEIMNSGSTEL